MDIAAANWNEDDNANTTSAPDGAPEGMAPSGVNNVLRAHQGALKRFYNWTIPKITAGSGTAYTLSYAVAPGSLVDGMKHLVQFHAINGASPTLNVNNLGATPLHYHVAGAWRVAPPGLIDSDEVCGVAYHSSSGAYRLIGRRNRTGEVVPFAGSAAPAGTLLCYGQAISRTAYAGLFAVIGTSYGAGDGSTTFALPDLRSRAPIGKSDMGGADAGILSGSTTLGAAIGSQANTATTNVAGSGSGYAVGTALSDEPNAAEFRSAAGPQEQQVTLSHKHNVNINIPVSVGVNTSGTSAAFSIVQPSRVLNYLIRI